MTPVFEGSCFYVGTPDSILTLFLPASPAVTVSSVHLVAREPVEILDTGTGELSACLSQWGIGSCKRFAE